MFLKHIELAGFKSFPEPTEVIFGQGTTGIVGPNGCGKSNLTDAVRWVLGEQRARVLRGGKMEEVIFGGTPQRPPLSAAEVTLVIDNHMRDLPCDFEEVAITRRLDRSGESEYRLNRTPCRLKDIADMLMDTGMGSHSYSVIQQGMIDAIISENPEERRNLFEEAAGVSKYKWRKKAALRKLEATESDLIRLTDLKNEVATHARSLARQKGRAEKHRQLCDELRTLQIAEALREYRGLLGARNAVDGRIRAAHDHGAGLKAEYDKADLEWQGLRLTTEQAEKTATEIADRLSAVVQEWHTAETHRVQMADRIRYLDSERVELKQRLTSLSSHLDETVARLAKTESARSEALREKDDVATQAKQAEEAYRKAKTDVQEAEERYKQVDDEYNVATRERAQLDAQRATTTERRQNWGRLIQELTARRDRAREDHAQTASEMSQLKSAIDSVENALAELQHQFQEAKLRLAQLESERVQLESDARSWNERLQEWKSAHDLLSGMIARGEGLGPATEAALATPERWNGHISAFSDRLHPDAGWEKAVESALAHRVGALWCQDRESAEALVTFLTEAPRGRAVVLDPSLLPAVAAPRSGCDDPGFLGYLSQKIQFAPDVQPWVESLLGSVAITETAGDARRVFDLLKGQCAVVSRDGILIEQSGALHAGASTATQSESVVGRSHRLAEIQTRITAGVESQAATRRRLDEVASAVLRCADESDQAEKRVQAREEELRTLHLSLEGVTARATELARLRDELDSDLTQRQSSLAADDVFHGRQDEAIRDQERRVADLTDRRKEASAAVARLGEILTAAGVAVNDARIHVVEVQAQCNALDTDHQRLNESINDIREEERRLRERITANESEGAALQRDGEAIGREHARLTQMRDHLEAERSATRAAAMRQHELFAAADVRFKEIRRSADEAERARSQVALEGSRLNIEIDQCRRRISDTLQTDPDNAHAEDLPLSSEELKARVAELGERIESLGPVNPLALEEYEREKQRWDFFEKQVGDLRAAKKALTETIAELNITAGRQFMETFETARLNFQGVFTQLFRGGEADVHLANPDDPLDSPIEILARPRGKKFIGLRQLSGGERALTALALLFGLYLVKPSPFCILDEVDAPLDDANCGRFLKLVERFKSRTQFIIATHNKLTMEAADVLYGVTMEQPGVSRIVSVRLDHAGEPQSGAALIVPDTDELEADGPSAASSATKTVAPADN